MESEKSGIFNVVPGRHYVAVWFVSGPDQPRDFMGALFKDPDQPYRFTYRLRSYADERVFGSQDTKRAFTFEALPEKDEAAVLADIRRLVETVPKSIGLTEIDEVMINSAEALVILQKIAARPWAHIVTTAKGGEA